MSQIHNGIFGALAVGLLFGAAQLAFGHDLSGGDAAVGSGAGINRVAKTDRAPAPAALVATLTVGFRPDGMAETSVLVRVPVDKQARNRPAPPSLLKSRDSGTAVACEPPVSVLAEVAKLLQPGRCVT